MGQEVALRPGTCVARGATDSRLGKQVEAWLRGQQLRLGISFEQCAKRAKVAPTVVSKFLRDGHPVPKMESLGRLADYAGTDLGSIFVAETPSGYVERECPAYIG